MYFFKGLAVAAAVTTAVSAQCTTQAVVNDVMEFANSPDTPITQKCQRRVQIQDCLNSLPADDASVIFAKGQLDAAVLLLDGACDPLPENTEPPSITARDNSIIFSAEHMKIKRRSRDELSLFDMYDEVMNVRSEMSSMLVVNEAQLEGQSSTISGILGPMQSTLSVAMEVLGKVQGRVGVIERRNYCVPGIEYQSGVDADGNPVCSYLRAACPPGQWPSVLPNRTRDRGCAAWTECGEKEFEVSPGTAAADRVCQACSTKCSQGEGWNIVENCTATTDIVCSKVPGLSRENPAESCTQIKKISPKTESGVFWVRASNGQTRQVFCEQERWGGGWMRIGHQKKDTRNHGYTRCWRSSGDCNIQYAPGTTKKGDEMRTWKYSDSFINSFNYDVLWGEYYRLHGGLGSAQREAAGGVHIWHRGKAVGECTLQWDRTVSGACRCTYDRWSDPKTNTLPDQDKCCGQWSHGDHGCHRGIGDWPCRGGEATLNHCHGPGYHTYLTGHRQGTSHGDSDGRSDMNQWIRVKF